jgi:hypothetical protein
METLSEQALLELAWLYARSGRFEEAVKIWQALATRGVLEAIERLAKYFEHSHPDYPTALTYTNALLAQETHSAAHRKRLTRVQTKLAKRPQQSISSEQTS